MKKVIKSISLGLALCLMLTVLTACGKKDEETPNGTNPPVISTDEPTQDNSSEPSSENTTKEEKEEKESQTKENQKNSVKKPETSEEIIEAYNKALSAKMPACTLVKQKVTEGTLGTKDKVVVDLSQESEAEFRKTFERNDKNGAALPSLSASDVKSASISGNTVTITLNNLSTSGSLSKSVNGYVNIVDDARVKELVAAVAEATNVSGVKVKSADHSLTDGKIVAVFNDDFTKLVSVSITYKQAVNAKMSWTLITILANLKYDVTTEYKG